MMKKLKILFILLAGLSLNSCNQPESSAESGIEANQDVEKTEVEKGDAGVVITNSYDAEKLPDGEFISYYDEENIKAKGNVVGGKRTGVWESFHPNGNKQSENEYVDGVLHGKSFVMYDNGQMMYIGYFANGQYDGQWLYFDKDGVTEKEIIYKNGTVVQVTEGEDLLQ